MLLYNLTGEEQYRRAVEGTMQDWFPGGSLRYSPKGLAYRLQWGSLRYACQLVTCGHPFTLSVGYMMVVTPVGWLHDGGRPCTPVNWLPDCGHPCTPVSWLHVVTPSRLSVGCMTVVTPSRLSVVI